MKRNFKILMSLLVLICALSACGKEEEFKGIWQKENSGHSLYVVGDGTVYMGDLGDVKKDELMYESKNLYTGEVDGGKLYITNPKYEMSHSYEKDGDVLIDEEGIKWRYIKESANIVKDE